MAVKFTLKELKERMEDNELDLGLSSLTENDLPLKEMVCNHVMYYHLSSM